MTSSHRGFLVLADIRGFTSYLAGSELDHANDVLDELMELIAGRVALLLTVVEFEGGAVYARADTAAIRLGKMLLELLESTYVAFRDRVEAIKRHTTCNCNACRLIPRLDLKVIVHFGEYILQSLEGAEKPIGPAVKLVHRLSKNGVTKATGWPASILLTEPAVNQLGLDAAAMQRGVEHYEHLGEVVTFSVDLTERYRARAAARWVILSPEEAHATITVDLPTAPAIAWEWRNDPGKRLEWEGLQVVADKAGGRRGMGTTNHCLHAKGATVIETILDWRPFDYFAYESRDADKPQPVLIVTHEITPMPSGA